MALLLEGCLLTTSLRGLSGGEANEAGTPGDAAIEAALESSLEASADAAIDPALAGWWRFDETAGQTATDSSGNGNVGILLGGATWGSGRVGGAIALDGVDAYVEVAASSSLVFSDEVTVAFWLRSTTDPLIQPRLMSHPGSWSMKLNNVNPQFTSGAKFAIAQFDLPPGEWHHVAFTFKSGQALFYVDGASVAVFGSNPFTAAETLPPGTGMNLGTDSPTSSPHLKGLLDEVRVYRRALTAAEVHELSL
jgi:hypothetical protein